MQQTNCQWILKSRPKGTLSTDNFVCKKNDVGMSTVNKINEVIEDMKTDGALEKKLGDCYFSPEMVPVP